MSFNIPTFREFLQDKHMENYHGTDDNAPDAFDAWVTDMQVDDLIQYGEEFAIKEYRRGIEDKAKYVKSFIENCYIEIKNGQGQEYISKEKLLKLFQ